MVLTGKALSVPEKGASGDIRMCPWGNQKGNWEYSEGCHGGSASGTVEILSWPESSGNRQLGEGGRTFQVGSSSCQEASRQVRKALTLSLSTFPHGLVTSLTLLTPTLC